MASDFTGGPGFLAFVVTFGLVVAGVLLFLSLSKHLRKVRAQAAREAAEREQDAAASSPDDTGSGDGEGRDGGGDEVTGEPGDR
ncbi:hypothetical protein QQX09_07085 [Demequina sp. SYSU T00192]|uniref:Uncharacterized protein n=1 Tax=Demequina litoralis TaxID=3051660 RepID=A0ABT8G9H7_9MICO|nr:hypothetical protein [Demequina sp. SYSU T00192]MDN4475614.1 hypothetical protein [Demequina sp. SYSU T00192]